MPRLFSTASFRLSLLYSAVFAAGFTILMLVNYWTATTSLRDQIRNKIDEDIQSFIADAATDGAPSIVSDIDERVRSFGNAAGFYYMADRAGHRLAGNLKSISLRDGWQTVDFVDTGVDLSARSGDADHQLWGKGTHLPDGSYLFIGQDAARVLSAQESIINSFLWSLGIAFLLAATCGALISRSLLRQIDAINRTSLAIMGGRFKERIPVRGTSDEIDRLSMNLNQLFDNNQHLLESLKQVTTNIAHDLRTPLSRLRQGLEEARIGQKRESELRTAIDAATSESDQLLATFAALLRIAQIESGSRKAGFQMVDLSAVLERVADAYKAVAEDNRKTLDAQLAPGMMVFGDRDLLLQMVTNILENAIRHTSSGTRIVLRLRKVDARVVADISDNGPGIPEDERLKVFERFYRRESSRTEPGSGLGLALVHAVADLHGFNLTLEDNYPGLRVTIQIPALVPQ